MLSLSLDNEMKKKLKPLGLSMEHFKIMMTLLEKDQLTQTEIGKKIMSPNYSLSRNLDKLESDGLLKREKHKTSRRSHNIRLTDKGRRLAPELFSVVKAVNHHLHAELDSAEAQQLDKILKKLLASYL